MSDKHPERRGLDPDVHRILDGEPPSDSAASEGDLRRSEPARSQIETFEHLGSWLRATDSRAPSSLLERVMERIHEETAPARLPTPSAGHPRWKRLQAWMAPRRAWIPALAAAGAVIVLLNLPEGRSPAPTDDILQSSDRAANLAETAKISHTGAPKDMVRYMFRVRAAAGKVCLAGDFNRWTVCEAPLQRVGEDLWSITVDLPPGRHEYMFVIDGKWVTDPNARAYQDDGFGNRNAVVVI